MPMDREKKAWPIALIITSGVKAENLGLNKKNNVESISPVIAEYIAIRIMNIKKIGIKKLTDLPIPFTTP